MLIRNCMKKNVVSIPLVTTIAEAAEAIVRMHIGTLPVVDLEGRLAGVLRLDDLLKLEMPDFLDLVEDVDFVHDFGAVETTRPGQRQLSRLVASIMCPAVSIEEDSGLLRAYAVMLKNALYDLPVVNVHGELVGIVSRADIGAAVLALWQRSEA